MATKTDRLEPGRYYEVDASAHGFVPSTGRDQVGVVICRRRADYTTMVIPEGAAFGACALCHAEIVFDPQGPHQDAPKVCGRCVGITPV